jgi:serine/threonine protein kinase
MTLRRFPWKAPRVSDNSYKLFVTEPSEEERRSSLYPQKPYSEPTSRAQSDPNAGGEPAKKEGSEGGAKSEPEDRRAASSSSSTVSTATAPPTSQPQTIKGPWRLLRLLPRETRHIIGRMLELDPKKRATLEEVLHDPWVHHNMQSGKVCSQEWNGGIHRAEGHEHTLEPGGGGSAPPTKK